MGLAWLEGNRMLADASVAPWVIGAVLVFGGILLLSRASDPYGRLKERDASRGLDRTSLIKDKDLWVRQQRIGWTFCAVLAFGLAIVVFVLGVIDLQWQANHTPQDSQQPSSRQPWDGH
jgi:hypothetical protein